MEGNQNVYENNPKLFGESSKSKRIKISINDEIKSNTLTLESLPEEILIQIFDFLWAEDLLKATLVSKRFNTIISKSSKLLNKILFTYNSWMQTRNWSGSRKYPNVRIYCEDTVELRSLRFDKASVKFLDFDFDNADLHEVRLFLVEFVNLEELSIACKDSNKPKDCEILPLEKRNLRKLAFDFNKCGNDGIDHFMKLIYNWQVKELIIKHDINFIKHQNTLNFLLNQNSLEHLDVESADLTPLIDKKFELKSLKIRLSDDIRADSLTKFLQNHPDSLTELDIYKISDETAESLNKFTKLKKLTVWRQGVSKKFKLSTIENLELYQCESDHLFPFVKELHLERSNLTTIGDMKYLHKLTVLCSQVNEISIPSVKVLILKSSSFLTRPFKFETSNLDELVIHFHYKSQNWFIEYLDRAETQLKRLKIYNSLIIPNNIAAIERNYYKIKCFETERCSEESKEEDYLGESSDFLTLKKLINK